MVIITHSLPESTTLFFMYMFHMPVFLGISGFLLKESTFKNGFTGYLKKITPRIVLPWLVAFAIYLPFQLARFSSNLIDLIIYPFYHLWYIPAYILGALVCYCICKWKIPASVMLTLTGVITFTWYVYFRDIHLALHHQPLYWLGDKRFYSYLFFYVLGYSLRNGLLKIRISPIVSLFIVASSFLLIALCVFQHVPDYLTVIPYMFLNSSLVLFLVLYLAERPVMQHTFWLRINTQSLGIYFYHPLLLIFIYRLLSDPLKEKVSTPAGLLIGIITVALCFPLTWLMQKWKFSNKYMLGNV